MGGNLPLKFSTTFPLLPTISRSNTRLYSIGKQGKVAASARVMVDMPFDLIGEHAAAAGLGSTR